MLYANQENENRKFANKIRAFSKFQSLNTESASLLAKIKSLLYQQNSRL